jgi:hypothetical protein
MLNTGEKGFIPNRLTVKASNENSSIMTVAAFQEKVSALSTGSKF